MRAIIIYKSRGRPHLESSPVTPQLKKETAELEKVEHLLPIRQG